jgi:hypothetical protein
MTNIVEEKEIIQNGVVVGYKQYMHSHYCFGLSFCGYRWLID